MRGDVFAFVALLVPANKAGPVTGVVGAAGGLGGFVPPLVMGSLYGAYGSYALGLVLLAVVAAAALTFTGTGVRHAVTRRVPHPGALSGKESHAMCEYCGCQALETIDKLTQEHERVVTLISHVRDAHRGGEVTRMAEVAREITAVLGPHTQVEEEGLFPALAGDFPCLRAAAEPLPGAPSIRVHASGILVGSA
ncbi:hemerythrin domain-containing protein [Streptomyces antimycoticus]|uniref:hemerythrin domain-containing protein n=1 Tax=Streptomyces antimycoticus TaxID=68175 RepID=UPI003449BDBC